MFINTQRTDMRERLLTAAQTGRLRHGLNMLMGRSMAIPIVLEEATEEELHKFDDEW